MNPLVTTQDQIGADAQNGIFRALVVAEVGVELVVQRDGSYIAEGPYPVIEGHSAIVGDEVVVGRVGTGYVVFGRIIRSGLTARPPIPLAFAEINGFVSTSSGTLVDIPGLTVDISLWRPMRLFTVMAFDMDVSGGGSAVLGVAISMHGEDHLEKQQSLSAAGALEIGAYVHSHNVEDLATVTVKGRYRKVSGGATPGITHAALAVLGIPPELGAIPAP